MEYPIYGMITSYQNNLLLVISYCTVLYGQLEILPGIKSTLPKCKNTNLSLLFTMVREDITSAKLFWCLIGGWSGQNWLRIDTLFLKSCLLIWELDWVRLHVTVQKWWLYRARNLKARGIQGIPGHGLLLLILFIEGFMVPVMDKAMCQSRRHGKAK